MSFLSSLMNALPGAAAQGLAWGIMAIGVYITFRIPVSYTHLFSVATNATS